MVWRYADIVHDTGGPAVRITSRHNPLVARFREAADGGARAPMLLDGAHLVRDAVEAGIALTAVAVSDTATGRPEIAALRDRLSATVVSDSVLAAMSPTRTPSGIVALADRPWHEPEAALTGVPLVLVAVGIQDPGNLGAMIRSAEAGGATGVLTTTDCADAFHWKALRGAMGSSFRLPVARVPDAAAALSLLRRAGVQTAATVREGGVPMGQARLTGPIALLLGSEGAGLPPDIVASSDLRVGIPMAPRVDSLNVAVAAALLVYEVRRQRGAADAEGTARHG